METDRVITSSSLLKNKNKTMRNSCNSVSVKLITDNDYLRMEIVKISMTHKLVISGLSVVL